jgi:predicted ArsR family transcriptional regulator
MDLRRLVPRHRLKPLFLATTRGKVLDRLRRAPQTVDELARGLGLTGNAVRSHVAVLEQDGLVRRSGLRASARRPSHTYRLAAAVETLFCQAYVPFLDEFLRVLARKVPRPGLDAVVRSAGRQMAPVHATGPLAARVHEAAAFLEELGGITEVKRHDNGGTSFAIHGLSCPLGAVVRAHPVVCTAVESLVEEMTQARAHQRCQHTAGAPRCLIEVAPDAPKRAGAGTRAR